MKGPDATSRRRAFGRGRPVAVPVPAMVPAAHKSVSVAVAVAIIADRLPKAKGEDLRTTKDKVRKRIRDAINRKRLSSAVGDMVNFGEVIEWASEIPNWRAALIGLPRTHQAGMKPVQLRTKSSAVQPTVIYGKEDCTVRLSLAHARIETLEAELSAALAEVISLRPIAARMDALRAKNRKNAKLRRPKNGGEDK